MRRDEMAPGLGRALACLLVGAAVACGGGEDGEGPAEVGVTIAPAEVELAPGATQRFSASLSGTGDARVRWSVVESEPGGAIAEDGVYTAPAEGGTYHVRAEADGHPGVSATATVVVSQGASPRIVVSPDRWGFRPGESFVFRAETSGLADPRVVWSVEGGPDPGAIDAEGRYTASRTPGRYRVVARSVASPGIVGTASVVLLGLTISPAETTVELGEEVRFTVTHWGLVESPLVWNLAGGTVAGGSDGSWLYTPPQFGGTYELTVTSVADWNLPTRATVTVTSDGVYLIDRGGPVLPTAHVYAIWWGDQGFLADSAAAFEAFIGELEGSSYLAIADQYLRGEKAHVVFSGHFFEPDIPTEPSHSIISPKACSVITRAGSVDPLGIYFIFTSFGWPNPGAAGWHASDDCNGAIMRVVWISPGPQFLDPCQVRSGPAAAAVGIASHELFETMTDPGPGHHAWIDGLGGEIADKCWFHCSTVGNTVWWTASLWSNATLSCEPR